jgi:hypothetical protein
MSEISGERIEPAARVVEPQGPEPRGRNHSESRRRRPPTTAEPELVDDSDTPAHQVDRLA